MHDISSCLLLSLTIYLQINESWTNNHIIAIDLHISLGLFFPEYLSRVNNFTISNPEILHDYFTVSKQTTVPELVQLWLKVASSFHGVIYKINVDQLEKTFPQWSVASQPVDTRQKRNLNESKMQQLRIQR